LRFSKFKVTPEGTVREERMIVAQEVFDFDTNEYPLDPLKVQVVPLFKAAFLRLGGGVGRGTAIAPAKTLLAVRRTVKIITAVGRSMATR
jgi:hypothetical protein